MGWSVEATLDILLSLVSTHKYMSLSVLRGLLSLRHREWWHLPFVGHVHALI